MGIGVPGVGATNRQSSDSSRSADPDEDVEARLPCLMTRAPAPAATIPAVVDTLNRL